MTFAHLSFIRLSFGPLKFPTNWFSSRSFDWGQPFVCFASIKSPSKIVSENRTPHPSNDLTGKIFCGWTKSRNANNNWWTNFRLFLLSGSIFDIDTFCVRAHFNDTQQSVKQWRLFLGANPFLNHSVQDTHKWHCACKIDANSIEPY